MHVVLDSLLLVLQPENLALMTLGVFIGFIVGVLPGLGGGVTLALMLPFTFGMEPVSAFAFLLGMFVVTSTTGDLTSVLFGIPGEATSAATVLDGYPMARRGEAGRALGAVLTSSLLGGLFGGIFLALAIPVIRPMILAFGPPEFFAMTVLGLSFIVSLSGRNMTKGFAMAALGCAVALIGMDPLAGVPRFTFDQLALFDGIALIPLVVGLFGGPEVLMLMLGTGSIAKQSGPKLRTLHGVAQGARDVFQRIGLTLRCSSIGVLLGVIPGLGGAVSQFIAYGHAQQTSKTPETFGRGNVEGVIAAGSVNNSKEGGALIPTVAFGIPGSGVMAILLSAFLIAGLVPGPEMLTTHLDVTYSMVWIMVIANIMAVVLALACVGQLAKLTFINGRLLVPFLVGLLVLGAYSSSNSMSDVVVMLMSAVLGIFCLRYDWPRVPFLLAFVLAPSAERYLYISNQLYGFSWLVHPLVLTIGSVAVVGILLPALRRAVRARRDRTKPSDEPVDHHAYQE